MTFTTPGVLSRAGLPGIDRHRRTDRAAEISGYVGRLGRQIRHGSYGSAQGDHNQSGEAFRHCRPGRFLEVGKDADIVITDGDPLAMFTTVVKVLVNGEIAA